MQRALGNSKLHNLCGYLFFLIRNQGVQGMTQLELDLESEEGADMFTVRGPSQRKALW